MVTVRRVGAADVDAWARLRVALMVEEGLLSDGEDPASLTAAVAAWLRERLDAQLFGAYVAEIDGAVVGSGGIIVYDSPPGPGLATREAYIMQLRRNGVTEPVRSDLMHRRSHALRTIPDIAWRESPVSGAQDRTNR